MKKFLSVIMVFALLFVLVGCNTKFPSVDDVGISLDSTEKETLPTKKPTSKEENTTMTMGQKNALKQAKSYLDMMAFSKTGLIKQLEFEGYSTADATFAVDNCNANWKEQAAKKAKSYLDIMPFSKEGLIEQLEFEGFSHEEAVYGAEANGY